MSIAFPTGPRRRGFLRGAAALAGVFGAGNAANLLLGAGVARAADYKALVCVFLYGGNDGMNTVLPTDASRWSQYSAVRGALALPRSSLLTLPGSDYALHPALAALAPAWAAGHLAPVFNVGPLRTPLSKSQMLSVGPNSPLLPGGLYSHSDQQQLWESGGADVAQRTGWGGRAADELATVNPVISVSTAARFCLSAKRTPIVVPAPGADFGAYGLRAADQQWATNAARKAAVDTLLAQAQEIDLADAFRAQQVDAFSVSARLAALVKARPGGPGALPALDAAFAPLIRSGQFTTGLASQLYQAASLIAGNAAVGGNRQIFFAQLDGFDTHANQIVLGDPTRGVHADLLAELGDALGAFHAALDLLGLGGAVTTCTHSDFGRTFTPNTSLGTDHGWGSTQLVLGAAVRGGRTYGIYPQLVLGGSDDVGTAAWDAQGRWIPTLSVDQYAATLLAWFGATPAAQATVLPNLANFGAAPRLDFV